MFSEYTDYRDYLFHWFHEAKRRNAKLSHRFVQRHLGLKSPNHFHLVIHKKRHLSLDTLVKLDKLLKMTAKERACWRLLFDATVTSDVEQRQVIREKLARLDRELAAPDSRQELTLLTNALAWYLKMGALQFHRKTAAEITELVRRSCPFGASADEVGKALALLESTACARLEGQRFHFDFSNLKTPWDLDHGQIKVFHRTMLELALTAVSWPVDQRFFANVTIPANEELLQTAKQEVRDLCLKLLSQSDATISGPEHCQKVVTLQFALFPYFNFGDSGSKN